MDDLAKRIAALSPERRALLALQLEESGATAADGNGANGSFGGEKRIVSYVVPRPQQAVTADELRRFLKGKLPDFMLPAAFEFLDAMPLTATGKVNRGALPDPRTSRPELATSFATPQTAVEQTVAAIWRVVLQVDRVGVNDNFFDLGGHSLLLIQVQAKLKEVFGEVSVVDLFKYPTVSSLAQFLARGQAAAEVAAPAAAEATGSSTPAAAPTNEIAIVGMAGRFPQARSVEEFWQNLRDGIESISIFTPEELVASGVDPEIARRPDYVGAKAVLDGVDQFDAAFFGFNPREAETLDPQQRLFLECAWEALEDAGINPDTDQRHIGVYAGASPNTYLTYNILRNPEAAKYASTMQTRIANDANHLPTLTSYKLNLKGPSLNVQTACSTSLVAAHLACQSLLSGECDVALAGGVSVGFPQTSGYLYEPGGIYSPDGHCRAFDSQAAGTVGGSGVGVVVLKRLADAVADGDVIRAVIKGTAINNDGAHKVGYTAPSVEGESQVIAAAHSKAKVEPSSIGYVEAHGTGTSLGDPIEIAALAQAFERGETRPHSCVIGSVKTNIGHLDAAAGVAGLIKTVLALEHKQLPPSLHFAEPNPQINFADSPFYVSTKLSEWETNGPPRRAGVSSFGIGGTNSHLVLEEAPPPRESDESSRPVQLLLLSAKTDSALDAATANLLDHLERRPEQNLADVAYTLQTGRRAFARRRAIICRNAAAACAAWAKRDPKRVIYAAHDGKTRPVVFMFPGQGAQYVNMGLELYHTEPTFRAEVNQSAELLKPHLGLDLREVLYPQEAAETASDQLKQTALAQPALFVVEYALARMWMEWGVLPEAMIGHSIGEYVAACLAGVFSLADALALVSLRGRLMQELPRGSMLALPLPHEQVAALLGEQLSLASINGPAQCVVSGPDDAVEALQRRLARMEIESHRLHTSHAFHSQMMGPILEEFAEAVRVISPKSPAIPYLSNVTGTWIDPAEATDPEYWAKHLRQTVRFADGARELAKEPERLFLEVGPGHGLCALLRAQKGAHDSPPEAFPVLRHVHDRSSDAEFLARTLGLLWGAGTRIDWAGYYRHERRRRVRAPTYPFERRSYWIEPVLRGAASRGDGDGAIRKRPLQDWFYVPRWKRTALPKAARHAQARTQEAWLMFLDGRGLGAKLAEQLRSDRRMLIEVTEGAEFRKLGEDLYAINPRRPADYETLLEELHGRGASPAHVIYMPGVTTDGGTATDCAPPPDFKETNFYGLLFLAQALAARQADGPLRLDVLANDSQQVIGEELIRPEKALALGVCKVLPQEQPHVACRYVDVLLPEAGGAQERRLVARLVAEFESDAPGAVVAYRGDQRWLQTFEQLPAEDTADGGSRLRQSGVYLLVGGLGAVGYVLAEHMAQTARARLALVGRTPLPQRAAWAGWLASHPEDDPVSARLRKISALEESGAQVVYYDADVSDEARMREVVSQIYGQFGELHGVVYAAVNTDEERFMPLLGDTSRADCERHFGPKVDGLLILEKLLRDRAPDFCLLCSSLSSVLGGLGFAAYAAANAFMDGFAQRQRSERASPWISVDWDAWRFGLDERARASSGAELAALAVTPDEGARAFERALSTEGEAQIVVSTGDLQARIGRHGGASASPRVALEEQPTTLALHPRPDVRSHYVAPRNETEQVIANIWQELLGIERIGVNDDFFALGGHSLLATRVNSRLREAFNVNLPLQRFFQSPTPAELADAVLEHLVGGQDAQDVAALLEEIERTISED